jgi:GNAT superfamily N-acetyltransferase
MTDSNRFATLTSIRDVSAGDRAVWERLFRAYGEFYKTSFDDTVIAGVWEWLMDAAHPTSAKVAERTTSRDGSTSVIGFAHFHQVPDTFTAAPEWFLDDLFVDPGARGSGAATALIEAVTDHARANGGGKIRWITAEDNVTAQSVYNRVATRTTWVTYQKESS